MCACSVCEASANSPVWGRGRAGERTVACLTNQPGVCVWRCPEPVPPPRQCPVSGIPCSVVDVLGRCFASPEPLTGESSPPSCPRYLCPRAAPGPGPARCGLRASVLILEDSLCPEASHWQWPEECLAPWLPLCPRAAPRCRAADVRQECRTAPRTPAGDKCEPGEPRRPRRQPRRANSQCRRVPRCLRCERWCRTRGDCGASERGGDAGAAMEVQCGPSWRRARHT